jgi:hypothetical protein
VEVVAVTAWLPAARHFLAAFFVVTIPAAILYWYLIHPFVGFWRRRGPAVTYLVVGVVCLALIAALVPWRNAWASFSTGAPSRSRWPAVATSPSPSSPARRSSPGTTPDGC